MSRDGSSVGREEVIDVRGALHHYGNANAAWVVTMGQVRSGAREESSVAGAAPVALYDGIGLARAMERAGIGLVRFSVPVIGLDMALLEELGVGQGRPAEARGSTHQPEAAESSRQGGRRRRGGEDALPEEHDQPAAGDEEKAAEAQDTDLEAEPPAAAAEDSAEDGDEQPRRRRRRRGGRGRRRRDEDGEASAEDATAAADAETSDQDEHEEASGDGPPTLVTPQPTDDEVVESSPEPSERSEPEEPSAGEKLAASPQGDEEDTLGEGPSAALRGEEMSVDSAADPSDEQGPSGRP